MQPRELPKDIYPIGYEFTLKRGKKGILTHLTVVDYLTTTNSKGEIVKFCYVTEHEFLSQKVRDYDVCHVTIQRAEWDKNHA